MSRNACNGENGESGEKSPAAGDLNWTSKVAPWRLTILAKMAILAKIASRWRFELDAKSGPLEASDFGEIGDFGRNRPACNGENGETGEKSPASGDFGKNRQRAGDMQQNIQIGCQKWPLQNR